MGCTYSKIHSRRKDYPFVKERMCGQCREAVADGRGSRKAELCAATRITSSGHSTCHFSQSPSIPTRLPTVVSLAAVSSE